jgi:hypothetical protein
MKLQCLQNKVLRTTGYFPRRTPVRDLHMAFKLLYVQVYDYIKIMQATSRSHTKHENENVRNVGEDEARHRKYKILKLGGGQAYDCSSEY